MRECLCLSILFSRYFVYFKKKYKLNKKSQLSFCDSILLLRKYGSK